jgi:hypothetical protein
LAQEINLHIKSIAKPNETDYEMLCTSGKSGHRKLAFEDSKRRKSNDFRKLIGFPDLTHATKMCLLSAGERDAAKLFSEALETILTRDLRIKKASTAHTKNVLVLYTPEEALSLFIEAHLTKKKSIHKGSKSSKNEEFPTSTQVFMKLKLLKNNDMFLRVKYSSRNL